MAALGPYILYIWGALGGAGVLCIYYGFGRLRAPDEERKRRRRGLWLVNTGVLLIALSLVLTIRAG